MTPSTSTTLPLVVAHSGELRLLGLEERDREHLAGIHAAEVHVRRQVLGDDDLADGAPHDHVLLEMMDGLFRSDHGRLRGRRGECEQGES
jgi:hypothetical protein